MTDEQFQINIAKLIRCHAQRLGDEIAGLAFYDPHLAMIFFQSVFATVCGSLEKDAFDAMMNEAGVPCGVEGCTCHVFSKVFAETCGEARSDYEITRLERGGAE